MTRPRCIVVCIVVCVVVCIVVHIVVLHSCSCCCHWRTVIFAIMVYSCILFFMLFFLFLLLLLLSVMCCQRLLLCRCPSFVVIRLPLLVAITVYCCFICFALCRIVSQNYMVKIDMQDRGGKDSVKKISGGWGNLY